MGQPHLVSTTGLDGIDGITLLVHTRTRDELPSSLPERPARPKRLDREKSPLLVDTDGHCSAHMLLDDIRTSGLELVGCFCRQQWEQKDELRLHYYLGVWRFVSSTAIKKAPAVQDAERAMRQLSPMLHINAWRARAFLGKGEDVKLVISLRDRSRLKHNGKPTGTVIHQVLRITEDMFYLAAP